MQVPGITLSMVIAICVGCTRTSTQQGEVSQAVRAWLTAADKGDSLKLDSLSADSLAILAVPALQRGSRAYFDTFVDGGARVHISAIEQDSAYVEASPSDPRRVALAIVLSHSARGWRVVNAAEFRRD